MFYDTVRQVYKRRINWRDRRSDRMIKYEMYEELKGYIKELLHVNLLY
jgi:hypothetical protein